MGLKMNHGPEYILFHIVNHNGHTVLAKYVKVKMTNDPYTYGMLNSMGEVYKGLIHMVPILNITNVPQVYNQDLTSLCYNYQDALHIDNTLMHIGDWSHLAEVHWYCYIKRRFAELAVIHSACGWP